VNEVKRFHFVFEKRDFHRFLSWRGFAPKRLGGQPGLYLLRDKNKKPLFVGHTLNLSRRLDQHAAAPAVSSEIAHIAILTGADLPGREYLAAFKEDLVRRHHPRWNVNLVGLGSSAIE
jgi:excinuclease UvrABC nuclease subunit